MKPDTLLIVGKGDCIDTICREFEDNVPPIYNIQKPKYSAKLYLGIYIRNIDFMHSFTIHESRNLKQARPNGQYVDLLR